jgi:thioredoxin-dependent peroxiredoxin
VPIGVSKDSVKSHDKFVAKYGLGIDHPGLGRRLGRTCERYGVWVEKSMYGKKYMGIERSTFLIDGSGWGAGTMWCVTSGAR